jgi:hypothetical protein
MNLPLTAPFDAFSISASSHTINGSLPPNSSRHFFIWDVATLAPADTRPVNVTALTSDYLTIIDILLVRNVVRSVVSLYPEMYHTVPSATID